MASRLYHQCGTRLVALEVASVSAFSLEDSPPSAVMAAAAVVSAGAHYANASRPEDMLAFAASPPSPVAGNSSSSSLPSPLVPLVGAALVSHHDGTPYAETRIGSSNHIPLLRVVVVVAELLCLSLARSF